MKSFTHNDETHQDRNHGAHKYHFHHVATIPNKEMATMYGKQRAIRDGLTYELDDERARNGAYQGNCKKCGKVGPFPGECLDCRSNTTIMVTMNKDPISPYLIARLARHEPNDDIIGRICKVATTDITCVYTRYCPDWIVPTWFQNWIERSDTAPVSLMFMRAGEWSSMVDLDEYPFLVEMARAPT